MLVQSLSQLTAINLSRLNSNSNLSRPHSPKCKDSLLRVLKSKLPMYA